MQKEVGYLGTISNRRNQRGDIPQDFSEMQYQHSELFLITLFADSVNACFLIPVFLAYLWLIVFSYYQQLQKCTLLEHRGSVVTVLTMPENGDVYTSHHKFLLRGKCDGAATGHIPDTKQLICDEK